MNLPKYIDKAREYVNSLAPSKFIPGQTYIPAASQVVDGDEVANLIDVALSQRYAEGKYAKQFKRSLRDYYKGTIRGVSLTNSGSSANLLAVSTITDSVFGDTHRAKVGDEFITVSAGFPTTINPLIQNGIVPVFIDVNLDTMTPDVEQIENAIIEGKTKGIILAHPLGNAFDAESIREICDEYGIWFIEDTCDALGGTLNGRMLGSFGDLGTLSFYPAHIIMSGEGGAIMTQSPLVEKVLESYCSWGKACWCLPGVDNTCGKRFDWKLGDLPEGYDHKYIFERIGYNLKMTDLQASILVAQMDKLPKFVEARRTNHKLLMDKLEKYSKYFRFQKTIPGADPCWFGFLITIKETSPFSRQEIIEFLESKKIGTRLLFSGNIIRQPAYKDVHYKVFGNLVNSDVIMRDTFWIGCHPAMTSEMLEYIVSSFDEFMESHV